MNTENDGDAVIDDIPSSSSGFHDSYENYACFLMGYNYFVCSQVTNAIAISA